MVHSLASHVPDELVLSAESNVIRDALQEGTLGINTGSICINDVETVNSLGSWVGANLDHTTNLNNVGTNTHAQIDTHVDGNGSDHTNVATNTTHTSGNGSDHTDVASNTTHRGNTSNPHTVTKTQVGLGNVTNVAQLPLAGGTLTGTLSIIPTTNSWLIIDSSDGYDAGIIIKENTTNKWSIYRDTSQGDDLQIFNYNAGVNTHAIKCDYATNKVTLALGTYINEFSTDGTLAGNSDDAVPTEKAVKTYVNTNALNHLDSTPADMSVSGLTVTETAGEGFTFGYIGYMKSDGKIWKTDADVATTMPARYLATGTINANASGTWLLIGFVRNDAWALTVGGELYASTSAGVFTHTKPSGTGDQVQIIGVAEHADRLYFNPSPVIVEIV